MAKFTEGGLLPADDPIFNGSLMMFSVRKPKQSTNSDEQEKPGKQPEESPEQSEQSFAQKGEVMNFSLEDITLELIEELAFAHGTTRKLASLLRTTRLSPIQEQMIYLALLNVEEAQERITAMSLKMGGEQPLND